MGKITGFKEFTRELPRKRSTAERVRDYKEIYLPFSEDKIRNQAARCMDCGVPTCHAGCPLGNIIPDWNDLVYRNLWKDAIDRLHATNNFPEFTGRLCPAPCEEACVLSINEPAVTIEEIEKQIIERAFNEGWVLPIRPETRTDKKIAVIGSGPAGLAAAQQLNRAGHFVTVYERDHKIGGLLRYGIPDFKMEKWVIDRRIDLMASEGITFKTDAVLGQNIPFDELEAYEAIVLGEGVEGLPSSLPELPDETVVGVGERADSIYLLHAAHVTAPLTGGELEELEEPADYPAVVRFTIRYVDGESHGLAFRLSQDVDHWFHQQVPESLPGAALAWQYRYRDSEGDHDHAALYSRGIPNPRPAEKIESLAFKLPEGERRAAYALLAITLAHSTDD